MIVLSDRHGSRPNVFQKSLHGLTSSLLLLPNFKDLAWPRLQGVPHASKAGETRQNFLDVADALNKVLHVLLHTGLLRLLSQQCSLQGEKIFQIGNGKLVILFWQLRWPYTHKKKTVQNQLVWDFCRNTAGYTSILSISVWSFCTVRSAISALT